MIVKKTETYESLNKKSSLIVDSMNRSINNKPAVYRDYEAVITVIMNMFNLPIGTLPYTPLEGFDLAHFLFRSQESLAFNEIEETLRNNIKRLINNVSCNVSINKDNDIGLVTITISFIDTNGILNYIPFTLEEDENNEIKIRYNKTYVKP